MSYNNQYYLHFVTDLKRVIFCMENGDTEGAKIFLKHAHKIFEQNLKLIMDGENQELRFNHVWIDMYNQTFPTSPADQKKYSEQLLTLASTIFLRSSASRSYSI